MKRVYYSKVYTERVLSQEQVCTMHILGSTTDQQQQQHAAGLAAARRCFRFLVLCNCFVFVHEIDMCFRLEGDKDICLNYTVSKIFLC